MKKFLTAAVALTVLASAGAASAGPYDQRRGDRQAERFERQDERAERRADRRADRAEARYERQAERRYNAGRYQRPAAYQERQWRRGDRLPSSYRSRAYVVDHRRYGLQAPPRGYQYTRVDNDAVLTAVASGVIASVLVGLFQ